jgi:aromatic ring-opening dioxygenase LigB subunit
MQQKKYRTKILSLLKNDFICKLFGKLKNIISNALNDLSVNIVIIGGIFEAISFRKY